MALVAAMGNEVGGAVVGEGRERCVEMVGSMSVDSEGVGLLHALGICLIHEEGAVTRVISGLPV